MRDIFSESAKLAWQPKVIKWYVFMVCFGKRKTE